MIYNVKMNHTYVSPLHLFGTKHKLVQYPKISTLKSFDKLQKECEKDL